uniref:Transmembrane protein n=1 Tax=Arabidopsis thaliana TaxID=3702 RepID=Q0WLX8_ARATH|nr:hypothetical protein [Arabidopsis thaliana]
MEFVKTNCLYIEKSSSQSHSTVRRIQRENGKLVQETNLMVFSVILYFPLLFSPFFVSSYWPL